MITMALNDSLEVSNDDADATYRVDYPYPHAVANEEEFITNSGRRLKKLMDASPYEQSQLKHPNPSFNPLVPPEISDSLQAELHLSLDRLSENSYDQDDLNRIKMKSQSGLRHTKTYPAVGSYSQVGDFNIQQRSGKHSVLSQGISVKSVADHTTSNREEEEYIDDDDIHTVVVDDSLTLDEGVKSSSAKKIDNGEELRMQKQIKDLQNNDPYSHLRYNPHWRNDAGRTAEQEDSINAETRLSQRKTTNLEENALLDSPNPLGGAIKIHNHEILGIDEIRQCSKGYSKVTLQFWNRGPPENHVTNDRLYRHGDKNLSSRDSPVRLSSDTSRLLRMNQKYEKEFHRMLEQEKQWQDPVESNSVTLSESLEKNTDNTPISQSKLQPPISYKTFIQENGVIVKPPCVHTPSSKPHRNSVSEYTPTATVEDSPQQKPTSVPNSKVTGSSAKEKRKSVGPTPPRAPKSNRDYIELNKIRLGRKSNSASYLEMYSKKNRLLEQAQLTPRRPLSDVRRKEDQVSSSAKKLEPNLNFENPPATVEEQWKEQAQRLKLAKEGKSPVSINPKRSLLREVGNQGVIKPSFSPRLLVGGPQRPPISSQHSPNGEFSPKRNMSPRREVNASPKSDFTNHPAFSPFTQPDSFSREQFEIESFPSKTTNQSHHLQHSNSTPYYNNEPYQRQPYSSDHQTITPNYTSDMVPAHGFHHVRQEDVRNFHPSPLMQAYHQHFGHSKAPDPHAVPLKHDYSHYYQTNYDSSMGDQRHRGEDTVPVPSHKFNPEVTSSYASDADRHRWNETDSSLDPSIYKNFDSTRNNPVPRLPPILGTTQVSPRQKELSKNTTDVEIRQSLSDSEAIGVGSYLQQHEKKKMKPSYKRYTLEDYKSLKREINMGGLGPDLVNAKAKMEKVNRAKKYSEFIRKQHKTNVVNLQNNTLEGRGLDEKYYPVEIKERFTLGSADQKREELQEKRKKALDYARQVPKPKPIVPVPSSNFSRTTSHESCDSDQANHAADWELLKNLRDRHEREKAIVAEMTSPHRIT